MLKLNASSRLLFIGDSITDCGRRGDPEEIGDGYVRLVRDYLLARGPAAAPVVINRGISGNKIPDLQKRWERDVLETAPGVLSVFIGINDVWHGLAFDRVGCDIEHYIAGYRDILQRTRPKLPGCQFVLCEPSVISPPAHDEGNARLAPYVRAVHDVAGEFGAIGVVPLHRAFIDAQSARPDVRWTTDGVHPTSAGHMLIARTWLKSTDLLD
jgi:lysophospholipase L1-like esterase